MDLVDDCFGCERARDLFRGLEDEAPDRLTILRHEVKLVPKSYYLFALLCGERRLIM